MATCILDGKDQYETPAAALSGTPGPPTEPPAGLLQSESDSIVRQLNVQIDTSVFRLLASATTVEQFQSLRREIFPKYCALAGAVGSVIKSDLEDFAVTELLESSFQSIEAIFSEDSVLLASGDGCREEAIFCLDSLKRAHFLLCQSIHTPPPEEKADHDAKLIQQTISRILWSQMHLRCLVYAIGKPISLPTPEVKWAILDGFRISLMAYAKAREAWGIRFDAADLGDSLAPVSVEDYEDRVLLNEAEQDYRFITERNHRGQVEVGLQ
jgi:hypothetical protein